MTEGYKKALEKEEYSYSVIDEEGKVLMCGGVFKHWHNRCEGWAIFSRDCKDEIASLHKKTMRLLDICPFDRIEIVVDVGFKQGHRWAKMLGFKKEAECLKKYRPDGTDAVLYARIR